MSQQSGTDDGAAILVVLVLGAIGAVALVAVTIVAFTLLAAWFGFTVRYPRQSAHFTMWLLMGLSIMAGFGVLWHYVWLWDIPPLRAWFIATILTVIPVCGLYLFINVPTGNNIIFRSIKMTFPLFALGGIVYWVFNGAGAVYDAAYCNGVLADARADSIIWNSYNETFGELCGLRIAEHWKTGFFFSCFWALSALYYPFGLIHTWFTKKRKYTLDDVIDFWNELWGQSRPVAQIKPSHQQSAKTTASAAATVEPSGYQAPPFRGR